MTVEPYSVTGGDNVTVIERADTGLVPALRMRLHHILHQVTMRYMLLTKPFTPAQYASALDSWTWLDLSNKTPVLASLFGHVFLAAHDGYWFLESVEGTLTRRWPTSQELNAALDTEAGQGELLLGGLAMSAHARGLVLDEHEVYDFAVPAVLGGGFSADNITKRDFATALNLAGQLHGQLQSMPPGSTISRFDFDDS